LGHETEIKKIRNHAVFEVVSNVHEHKNPYKIIIFQYYLHTIFFKTIKNPSGSSTSESSWIFYAKKQNKRSENHAKRVINIHNFTYLCNNLPVDPDKKAVKPDNSGVCGGVQENS
jgi:fucose permease